MNKQYKQDFLHAGALAKEVRSFGKSLIIKGAAYSEVICKVNKKIIELGAKPAFPPQIALNYVAAHFLPQPDEEIIFTDQVVKLDIGVSFNGAIGDCAVTVDLSGKIQSLIDAAEAALANAEKIIKVGLPIREIGNVIDATITSFGYQPIKNLCGHGLGLYQIHTPPHIPNYDDQSQGTIQAGMTFAIEPFATTGKGYIREEGEATIFSFVKRRPIQSEDARAIINKIKAFQGLPFAIHDLLSAELPIVRVKGGLNELLKSGSIVGYKPLVEGKTTFVAQAENSLLVDEKGQVFITTR